MLPFKGILQPPQLHTKPSLSAIVSLATLQYGCPCCRSVTHPHFPILCSSLDGSVMSSDPPKLFPMPWFAYYPCPLLCHLVQGAETCYLLLPMCYYLRATICVLFSSKLLMQSFSGNMSRQWPCCCLNVNSLASFPRSPGARHQPSSSDTSSNRPCSAHKALSEPVDSTFVHALAVMSNVAHQHSVTKGAQLCMVCSTEEDPFAQIVCLPNVPFYCLELVWILLQ